MAPRHVALLALALAAPPACDGVQTDLPPLGDVSGGRDADSPGVPPTVSGRIHYGALHLASKADEALYADVAAVAGDLVITAQDASGIHLPALVEVTGAVRVEGRLGAEASGNLTLPRLARVGGDLALRDTYAIGTVELPQLTWVGGHLDLQRGIFDLRAPRLAAVNGDVRFRDMRFARLDLAALATIGGSLRVLRYSSEAAGGSLPFDLPSLRGVEGDVTFSRGAPTAFKARRLAWIAGDLDLDDLEIGLELPSLASVSGDVRLESLDVFFFDLGGLRAIGGDLVISSAGGAALATLDLAGLEAVAGRLQLSGLATTAQIRLDALEDLGRRLQIDHLPHLAAVHLGALEVAHSDLLVTDNGLPLIAELAALRVVGGDLTFARNGALDLRASLLEEVVGDLRLERVHLSRVALNALAAVGRHLVIDDVISNDGVVAFPNLTAVGGDLTVRRSTYLSSALFAALTHIGSVSDGFAIGDLRLEHNADLQTLALDALTRVERHLSVRDNPRLDEAALLLALDAVVVGGERAICANLEGAPCD